MKLQIDYDNQTDTLSLWNGIPASEGYDIAENMIADVQVDGSAVGITLERARELLKPYLSIGSYAFNPDQSGSMLNDSALGVIASYDLKIDYEPMSDVLNLGSDEEAIKSQPVGDYMVANFNRDGDVIGITLENAGELLGPYFRSVYDSPPLPYTILRDGE